MQIIKKATKEYCPRCNHGGVKEYLQKSSKRRSKFKLQLFRLITVEFRELANKCFYVQHEHEQLQIWSNNSSLTPKHETVQE